MMMSAKKALKVIVVVLIIDALLFLSIRTGIFQAWAVDDRDLVRWNYESGLIAGNDEFTIEGDKDICWLLIHGYIATPDVVRALSLKINSEFGDYVQAPRLLGHASVPSDLSGLSFSDWREQIEEEFDTMSSFCGEINVGGSSLGGALSLWLAEHRDVGRVYPINSYVALASKPYHIFSLETYLKLLGSVLNYNRRTPKNMLINDPVGLAAHVAYWNLPFGPMLDSLGEIEDVRINAYKITEPILIQHSENDGIASFVGARGVYESATSDSKEFVAYTASNHVLLRDYDREDVVDEIIRFEKESRQR